MKSWLLHIRRIIECAMTLGAKKAFPVPFQDFSRARHCPAEMQIMMSMDENERFFSAQSAVTDVVRSKIVGNVMNANHRYLLPGVFRRISLAPGLGGCISRNFWSADITTKDCDNEQIATYNH